MGKCKCPKGASLTEIPVDADCQTNLEQVQKLLFQRPGYQFDTTAGAGATDPATKADWLALIAAVDDTKVVVTPLIKGEPVITPGEAITNGGGDNSTLNGVEEFNGVNPSVFTGLFKSLASATKRAMVELECEDLVVYMVNQYNQIIANEIAPGIFEGFPVPAGFFLSDRGNNGFGTKDTFAVRFSLAPRWDNYLAIVEPEAGFRPLVDLSA